MSIADFYVLCPGLQSPISLITDTLRKLEYKGIIKIDWNQWDGTTITVLNEPALRREHTLALLRFAAA